MEAEPTTIPGVLIIRASVIEDARGHFFESYRQAAFDELVGTKVRFVQENQSFSGKDVIRGLHCQIAPYPQGKLVRVVRGQVFDVAIDLRPSSRTFGQHVATVLNAESRNQIWIPEGFAHGFQVLSDGAEVAYKVTNYWSAEHERTIAWNDPTLKIAWPNPQTAVLSAKDRQAPQLSQFDIFSKT